jgi:hypothetical protein
MTARIEDALHVRPAVGPCEVHEWPTESLARRLVAAMRERHGKGGINACVECIVRARASLGDRDE